MGGCFSQKNSNHTHPNQNKDLSLQPKQTTNNDLANIPPTEIDQKIVQNKDECEVLDQSIIQNASQIQSKSEAQPIKKWQKKRNFLQPLPMTASQVLKKNLQAQKKIELILSKKNRLGQAYQKVNQKFANQKKSIKEHSDF